MKVKKLYEAPRFVNGRVVETVSGEYKMFNTTPYRHIQESDLTPVPWYQAKGRGAEEVPACVYSWYGLEKAK